MSKEFVEYLRHILYECDYIVSVIKVDTQREDFLLTKP